MDLAELLQAPKWTWQSYCRRQKWTWQSFTLVLVVFFVVPGEPTLVVPDIIPLKPTEWTEGLTVRPKEVLKLLVGSKVQELLFFELPTSVRSFVVL